MKLVESSRKSRFRNRDQIRVALYPSTGGCPPPAGLQRPLLQPRPHVRPHGPCRGRLGPAVAWSRPMCFSISGLQGSSSKCPLWMCGSTCPRSQGVMKTAFFTPHTAGESPRERTDAKSFAMVLTTTTKAPPPQDRLFLF